MRTQLTRSTPTRTARPGRTRPVALAVALALGLTVGACSSSDAGDDEAATTTAPATGTADDPAESAYCDAAREWAIHEVTQPVDETDPVAFEAYWNEFLAFEQTALDTTPDELAADWQRKVDTENETINPVLERYDYDVVALQENGTPEELATLEAPPDVEAAQDRILTYEADVCGAQQPRPADVSFEGEEAGAYCDAVAAEQERIGEVMGGGADPADVEALVAELVEGGPAQVDVAPASIQDDVAAVAAWTAGEQRDVLAAHGYDFIGVIREGTPEERADLQLTADAIRDQFARVAAYEEQVCDA